MPVISFGSGTLWGTRNDVSGATPAKFGILQDIQLEFSGTSKMLYGQGQFPEAVARGEVKITGKAKMGVLQPAIFTDMFHGSAAVQTAGYTDIAIDEDGTVPSGTGYTVTVANSANFVTDLGVTYAATGIPLKQVTSAPAAGEYSVAAGVYTFAAADANMAVKIDYEYSVAGTGITITVSQVNQGIQPTFEVRLKNTFTDDSGTQVSILRLFACMSDKLSIPTKMADFTIPEFDFSAFKARSGTNAGKVYSLAMNVAA